MTTNDDGKGTLVHGRCPKHGDWTWKSPYILSDSEQSKVPCPTCEGTPTVKVMRMDCEVLTGHCERHGPWENRVAIFAARAMKGRCPTCDAEKIRQKDEAERRERQANITSKRETKLAELFGASGVPRRFQSRTFDNYRVDLDGQKYALDRARRYAVNFDKVLEHGSSLILHGLPGTGKNHLASAIANHIIPKFGVSVLYTSVFGLMEKVKATYGAERKGDKALLDEIAGIDLLILDEVGVQMGTKHEEVVLTELINRRYSDLRPTILLSNLDMQQLEKQLGERIIDRMMEGGGSVIAMDWESYRPKVYKDEKLPKAAYQRPEWLGDAQEGEGQ